MIESVSKRTFTGGSSSGTYHVHALELAAAARVRRHAGLSVRVHFLDATDHEFQLDKRAKGAVLMTLVYQHLELVEKDYFGLQYCTEGGGRNGVAAANGNGTGGNLHRPETMRWLDAGKTIKKQLGNCPNDHDLYFRVKFYVNDPSKLQEEYTRYQFYLQVRNDIMDGRLVLPASTACLLASYTVQSELGDYHPDDHGPNYLSNLRLMPGQTEDMEGKISELHKLHKGQMPADAEFNFLDHAKRMDMYGVELHRAKDNTDKDLLLGVTANGLVVFQSNIRINTFSWSKIMKISFKRKHFFIQLRREPSENYDTVLGFNMETYRSSKTLWKACVEHHTFFRLHSPKVRRRFPLSLGSKFTYSGRTEFQTVTDIKQRGRLERKFVRSPSKTLMKYDVKAPALEDKGKTLVAPARPPRPYDNKVTSLGSKEPRKAWEEDDIRISDDDGGFLEKTLEGPFSPGIAGRVLSYADEEPSPTGVEGESEGGGLYDTPPYSAGHSPTTSHLLLGEDGVVTILLHPDSDGKYGFNVKGGSSSEEPILVSRVAPNTPADKCTPRLTEGDQLVVINGQDVSHGIHADVVQIIQEARATPTGKLVLTVRPNALYTALDGYEEPPYQYVPVGEILRPPSPRNALEQSMLLLADNLASGALVTQYDLLHRKHPDMTCDEASKMKNVNKNRYRDISPYDSTRVVLINGPNGGDYINANHVIMRIPTGTPTTSPPSPSPHANEIVNRYIATQGPLQTTSDDFWTMVHEQQCRLIVMLTTVIERGRAKCHKYWPNVGDVIYIGGSGTNSSTNAKLKVECVHEDGTEEGVVYRNLALTDMKANTSRTIRHMQYTSWPDHGVPENPAQFLSFTERVREERSKPPPPSPQPSSKSSKLSVKSPKDSSSKSSKSSSPSSDKDSKESTPPKLVPAADLTPATIDAVVEGSAGADDVPVVVHCSAGIGRTGVLVLMETALCLMEAGQPVYPLDIVQTMRRQRAMMIQNASQYKFVCESVQMAYTQKII